MNPDHLAKGMLSSGSYVNHCLCEWFAFYCRQAIFHISGNGKRTDVIHTLEFGLSWYGSHWSESKPLMVSVLLCLQCSSVRCLPFHSLVLSSVFASALGHCKMEYNHRFIKVFLPRKPIRMRRTRLCHDYEWNGI